ncbi:MAG: lysophospholipid acyltransferase family protein [Alistipes sp.]
MISTLYYLFLVLLCGSFMILSAIALVVTYPFDKSRRVVHALTRVMVGTFFFVPPFWRQKVSGLEHVDRSKSYVMVINHRSMIDIPSLYYVPLNFRWVSKREVFKIPFFGQFLSLHGDICINRGRAPAAMDQLLRDGKLWISRGASIAVFPEGTRSKDGEIHRFKAGAFTLAKGTGVEILPVVMDGTSTLIKPNRIFSWHNTINVRVLPPLSVAHIEATELHELMDEVHGQMVVALKEIRENKTCQKH